MLAINLGLGLTSRPVFGNGVPAFSPTDIASLRAWYDPGDLTSMFTGRFNNATGTSDYTNVNSVVGTIVDKSQLGGGTFGAWYAAQANIVTSLESGWLALSGAVTIGDDDAGTLQLTAGASDFATAVFNIPGSHNVNDLFVFSCRLIGGTAQMTAFMIDDGGGRNSVIFAKVFTVAGEQYGVGLFRVGNVNGVRLVLQSHLATNNNGKSFTASDIKVAKLPAGTNALSTPSDAARPILRESGGLYYLDGDGVDDTLGGLLTISGPLTVVTAARTSDINARYLYEFSAPSRADTAASLFTNDADSGGAQFRTFGTGFSNEANIVSGDVGGVDHVFASQHAADDFEAWVDGASIGTDTLGSWPVTTATNLSLLSNTTPAGFLAARLYGFASFSAILTDEERQNVEAYLAAKSGVTL